MDTLTVDLDRFALLDAHTSVFPKEIRPGALLMLPDAVLKWYDVGTPDVDLTALAVTARAYLATESAAGHLVLDDTLGFVELHHCGAFAFLIVSTWKRNNELWTSTYWIGLGQEVPIMWRVTESVAGHRPNLCIWEWFRSGTSGMPGFATSSRRAMTRPSVPISRTRSRAPRIAFHS